MAEIRHVTDENFEELVLKSERPTVVDFWAVWCGPCKMVAPEMEKLAAKYDGKVDVVKVDVDANPRLSQAFNIMSIPTIAFFKPGAHAPGRRRLPAARAARSAVRPGRVRDRCGRGARHRVRLRRLTRSLRFPRQDDHGFGRGRSIPGGLGARAREAAVGGQEPGTRPIGGVAVDDARGHVDPAAAAGRCPHVRRSRGGTRDEGVQQERGRRPVRGERREDLLATRPRDGAVIRGRRRGRPGRTAHPPRR